MTIRSTRPTPRCRRRAGSAAASWTHSKRPSPAAGTLSSHDGHSDLRGVEEARIRGQLHDPPRTGQTVAEPSEQAAGRAIRNGARRPGADGLGRIPDRLHAGRPSPGELVQLPAGLLATTISLLYRAAGLRDHGRPAHSAPSTTCKAWRRRACTTT